MDLVGVVCLLAFVALLGLASFGLARLFARMQPSPDSPPAPALRCPACNGRVDANRCVSCGRAIDREQVAVATLVSLRQQVNSLLAADRLTVDVGRRLVEAINAEAARLQQPAATTEEAPEAEVIAEVVEEPRSARPPASPRQMPYLQEIRPPLPVPSKPADAKPRTREALERETADRARQFEQQRQRADGERQPEIAEPRARLADLLAAFMEEKNVRWGELVGGLLIVGSSIALVISFWSEIAARPLLKFGLFNGVAAALFALGFYTEQKWKLPTTSRGVLAIATLLVPLNFLSIAAFTQGTSSVEPLVIAGELVSIGLFSVLVYLAARSIVTPAPLGLMVGVLGASTVQLLVRRWVTPEAPTGLLLALGSLPVACHVAAVGTALVRLRVRDTLDESDVNALLRMLGLTAFAALLPLGLLLSLAGEAGLTLQRMAPLVTAAGVPAMFVGLLLWQRLRQSPLTGLRTAGTAIAVLGSAIMLSSIALAWPSPAMLLAVALVGFFVLTIVARPFEMPAAHLPAGLALALGYLILVHVGRGSLGWHVETASETTRALASGASGNAMTLFAAVYGLAAAASFWWRRREDAVYCAVVTAGAALAGFVLITRYGFLHIGDPYGVTWSYALYAVGTVAAALMLSRPEVELPQRWRALPTVLAWSGSALLAMALVQGVVYWQVGTRLVAPWTTAVVMHTLIVVAAAIGLQRWLRSEVPAGAALQRSGIASSAFAVVLIATGTLGIAAAAVAPTAGAIHLALVAAAWLAGALLNRSEGLFAAFQAALFVAGGLAAVSFAQGETWYVEADQPALDPRMWQLQASVAAVGCLLWLGARLLRGRGWQGGTFGALLERSPHVDRGVSTAVLVVLLLTAAYGAMPGMMQELSREASVARLQARFAEAVEVRESGRVVPRADGFALPNVPHEPASSRGSWILLMLVVALFVAGLWQRASLTRVLALMAAAAAVGLLLVPRWEAAVATASAWRWWAVGYFTVGSVLYWSRPSLARWGRRLGWRGIERWTTRDVQSIFTTLVLNSAGPLVAISLYITATALLGNPVLGPGPGTFLFRIGPVFNYGAPVALLALVLSAYAVRERSPGFAFSAGLLANLVATIAYHFTAGASLAPTDPLLWVKLGQLNALVAAVYGLGWLSYATRWLPDVDEETTPGDSWRRVQAALALTLNLLVLVPAAFTLFVEPVNFDPWLTEVARPLGVAAVVAGLLLPLLLTGREAPVATTALVGLGLWMVATVIGLGVTAWDNGNWLAFRTLTVERAISPLLLLAGAWYYWRPRKIGFLDARRRAVTWCSTVLSLPLVLAAMRVLDHRELGLWWSPGVLVVAAGVATLLAAWSFRRRFLYVAAFVLLGAMAVLFLHPDSPLGDDTGLLAFINAIVCALSLPVVGWLAMEMRRIRPVRDQFARNIELPVHRLATWLAVAVTAVTAWVVIVANDAGTELWTSTTVGHLALWGTGIAAVACLWDPRAREAVAVLYLFGLALVGRYLVALNVSGDWLLWHGAVSLGAFTLATSYLWSRRVPLRAFAERFGMPPREGKTGDGLTWLVPLTTSLMAMVLVLVYWIELVCPDATLRISAAQAAIAQSFALGLLAGGERRAVLRNAALVVGALGMVAFGWSFVEPTDPHPVLLRSVATCVALVATTIVYGLGITRLPLRTDAWPTAAMSVVPGLVVALAGATVAVLAQEFVYFFDEGRVPLAWPGILAVAVALLALFAATLTAALLPGRDPLGLSERGRMTYVYAAEVMLLLAFLHVRFTMPWLFGGIFLQYWPLVVMVVAFLGVGLSEWFHRRRQAILAEPLERTSILLPLLPVVGFWLFDNQANYSIVLLFVGGLYAALAVTRKSFGFGVLAALAANGGLWHFLHRVGGLGLAEHPQLWLIPPALCVLAAAYLNRDRLTASQMTGVRYITSMTIYLSSTADIFLVGVRAAPWLPLLLAGLSLAGIFGGIVLRVRAFLFLGTGFLILSLMTMIYHAAVNLEQTWIWGVTGLVVGVAILVMFAVFEKKRQDILRLVEELKQWQG